VAGCADGKLRMADVDTNTVVAAWQVAALETHGKPP